MTTEGRAREVDPLVEGMTPAQREAALHTEGPLLIIAGPGSGKTRVITRRIAHLLRLGVPAWQILALTFTNKAAAEMRERVERLLGEEDPLLSPRSASTSSPASGRGVSGFGDAPRVARGLTVTTFHSLCARLLRRYLDAARLAGDVIPGVGSLTGTYSIYDSADQQALMKRVIGDVGLSTSNWPPGSALHAISRAKNRLMDAEAFSRGAMDFHSKTIAKIYEGYAKALRAANAVDFDDLLMLTVNLLRHSAGVRGEVQARWQYLMIDEYQDTNHAQFALAGLLVGSANVAVVGDPDQSIYGWRGADIGNILEFETRYPGTRVITLGENFRSAEPILRAADALITRNTKRKHKALIGARAAPKEGWKRAEIMLCRDERHEAALVCDWLRSRRESGVEWSQMAVAYRMNSLSRVMEDALRGAGTPYVIARGTAFYEREEVKDALAYLRLVANPADDVSLTRIVNKPARGISPATIERLRDWMGSEPMPLLAAIRTAGGGGAPGVTARAAKSLGAFAAMVDGWTGGGTFLGASVAGTLRELADRVIKESGLEKAHADKGEETGGEARLANLAELVSSAAEFEERFAAEEDAPEGVAGTTAAKGLLDALRAWLESVSLVADADAIDPASGALTMLTLHAAKGLEFDSVAIIGLEEGLLPHSRSRESNEELEEERRLMFVGVTRAKERALITSAKYRTIRGLTERTIPSQFLDELTSGAPGYVAVSDQSDAWAGDDEYGAGGGWGRDAGAWNRSEEKEFARPRAGVSREEVAIFPVGSKVRHPQFGVGKVKEVSGGMDARARVEFPGIGAKTLVLKYARLERVG